MAEKKREKVGGEKTKVKITVLIENTKRDDCLACEHGLSLLIEFQGKKYLLDSGSTDAFLGNADQLGESLGDVEWAFLSHGHWDHSGGFAEYLRRYPDKILYMGQGAAGDFASDANETEMHDISIPADLKTDFTKQIRVLAGKTKLAPDIWALPHTTPGLEKTGARVHLYRLVNGEAVPDDFSHEYSLVFEEERGLIILNSCSHAGVANIVKEVKEAFPGRRILAYAGGLHMMGRKNGQECSAYSEEELKKVCDDLVADGLEKLLAGHCTGRVAYGILKRYLGDRLEPLYTGQRIVL